VSSGRLAQMAVHRRPPVEGPPAELLTFRGDDWIATNEDPVEAWLNARFKWACDHPGDFSLGGDELDMLRERAAYRRGKWVP